MIICATKGSVPVFQQLASYNSAVFYALNLSLQCPVIYWLSASNVGGY